MYLWCLSVNYYIKFLVRNLYNVSQLLFSSYMYQLPLLSLLVMFTLLFCFLQLREIPYGLAVRIPGFHPGGPGSAPGMGTHFLVYKLRRCVPCFFYQSLRLVTVNLSKWDVLLQQLYYENFLTRYDWASKVGTLVISWNFFSTIRLARLVKWIWISISLTFKYSTSQFSEHIIQLLDIYFEELHYYSFQVLLLTVFPEYVSE